MSKFRLFIIAVICVLVAACGKSSSGPSEPTAMELCNSGWSAYETAAYSDALSDFEDALDKDSDMAEAYTGKGWTLIRQDLMSSAKTSLLTAINKSESTDYRNLIGIGSIYIIENNGPSTVALLAPHVNIPNTWYHDHDEEITAVELHNLLAEGYIMTGVEGDESSSTVNALDAWGQVKKSLSMDNTDTKALELQAYLKGE